MSSSSTPVSADHRKAIHRVEPYRVWAVLIGIDGYRSSPLHGCVADVGKMKNFLTVELGVPNNHIQCLVGTQPWPEPINSAIHLVGKLTETYSQYIGPRSDETTGISIASQEKRARDYTAHPTRKIIVETLLNLSTNPQIQHGDNIIIYFSGHGSSYDCSDIFPAKSIADAGTIEALCPIDRAPCNSSHGTTPDISDRELHSILLEISRTKGRHITCILDCCHSSGVTRVPRTQQYRVRSAKPLDPTSDSIKAMLEAGHTRLKGLKSYVDIRNGDWRPDMTSHVILAACKEFQSAKEVDRADGCSGIFTQALIEALKSDRLTKGSTYEDLIMALQMPSSTNQHPIVAGECIKARLWYQV